jgi:hypothetical protein
MVRGVPRVLAPHETQEMLHIGQVDGRNQYYTIEGPSPPVFSSNVNNAASRNFSSLHRSEKQNGIFDTPFGVSSNPQPVATSYNCIRNSNFQTNTKPIVNFVSPSTQPKYSHKSSLTPQPKQQTPNVLRPFSYISHRETTPPSSPMMISTALFSPKSQLQTLPPNSNVQTQSLTALTRPTPGKKEYCSYWLRHGECDYQQQGCLYKHEMPTDMATLSRLGLREIPRWYREAHGLSANSFINTVSSSANGLIRSRWAPGNSGFYGSGGGSGSTSGRDNWRTTASAGGSTSRSSAPAPAKPLSTPFSAPTKQFTLPMSPPSPPASPVTTTSSPSVQFARHGTRNIPAKGRSILMKTTAAKTTASAKNEKLDRHSRAKSVEPGDPLPSFPALAPVKRAEEMAEDGEVVE